jgi:hypothetical protein
VFAAAIFRIPRLLTAIAVSAAAVSVVTLLTLQGDAIPYLVTVHTLTFYGLTAAAYVALPYMRRGDVLMVAMWLVLAAGVAPCIAGQEISAPRMFADMAGVIMAAAPIYIARLRQVAQGDTRLHRRRQSERETASEELAEA